MKDDNKCKYLRRKFDSVLIEWKNQDDHLPLIVQGARQVGKTSTIHKFAKENYNSLVEINFFEQPDFKGITRDGFSAANIVKNITAVCPDFNFIPGKTLIFFDEIQEFPEIATAFKFLAQDGKYDIIASGSLLGIQYKRIASISVGYQDSLTMRSMDFEEYLWALGYSSAQIDDLINPLLDARPFSETIKSVFDRLFMEYCALGGMPAVVSRFVRNSSFSGIVQVQKQILNGYRSDIRKYSEGLDSAKIQNIFKTIPTILGFENKKFKYSYLEKGGKKKDYYGCIEWLEDSGVVNICRKMRVPELPIAGNIDFEAFKIYVSDSGLLCSMLDKWAQDDIRARRYLGTWKGGFFENVVAEAIMKADCEPVYYKKESSTLEIDFLLRSRSCLVPIEVKGENGTGKSLGYLIRSPIYKDIQWGIKLIHGNVGFENGILTIPQWCAFLLPRIVEEFNLSRH